MLIRLLLLGVIIACLWWILRPRNDFTIRIVDGQVIFYGDVPRSRHGDIRHFFEHKVAFDDSMKITGRRTHDGYVVLKFRGPISPSLEQKIRNYLVMIL